MASRYRDLPNLQFDEFVHLAVVGGGFLRTPFLHGVQELPDGNQINGQDCRLAGPEVIHIPSCLERNGYNMLHPHFRRVVFTSDLVKRISHDRAVVYNQESAGITFGFHGQCNHNIARVMLNDAGNIQGDRALVVDNIFPGFSTDQQSDINLLGVPGGIAMPVDSQPTGFLLFLSRFWHNLRNVEKGLLSKHIFPLQFDLDFNGLWIAEGDGSFTVNLPVWGNKGAVKAWDSRNGPGSYHPNGSPIGDSQGTLRVEQDQNGLPVLIVEAQATPNDVLPIAIQDESGQLYTRNIMTQGGTPGTNVVPLPSGRIGTPYAFSMPEGAIQRDAFLPRGMGINGSVISGIPLEVGSNYFIDVEFQPGSSIVEPQLVRLFLTVNRPQIDLMSCYDTLGCDNNTGEYYGVAFVPYGTQINYGGWSYECRRFRSQSNPYPYLREVPYVYGHGSRQAGWDYESLVREEADKEREQQLRETFG